MDSTLSTLLPCFRQLSLNPTTPNTEFMLMPANFQMPTLSPQEYDTDMPHEGQEYIMGGNIYHETIVSKYEEVTEGEEGDENYEDDANDLYIPPSNFTTVNDPHLKTFIRELMQDENNGYCSSYQKSCYFNDTDSYAIPHCGNRIQPVSQNIATIDIVERWLKEKLSHTGETIPILEESPQISAVSIMSKLREAASALNGLAKVLINIRAGHVYLLHMIGDEIVMAPNCERFFQQFPLFVNVSIKVQAHSPSVRHNTCQVLVAVEHVTMKTAGVLAPCKFSRVTSSSYGQLFCLLEEVATNADMIGNGGEYLYDGGFTGEIAVKH